jgi:hypothetical protein
MYSITLYSYIAKTELCKKNIQCNNLIVISVLRHFYFLAHPYCLVKVIQISILYHASIITFYFTILTLNIIDVTENIYMYSITLYSYIAKTELCKKNIQCNNLMIDDQIRLSK